MHEWIGVLTDVLASAANSLFCTIDGHVSDQKIGNAWTINKDKFVVPKNVQTLLRSLVQKKAFFKHPTVRRHIFMMGY